MDGQLFRVFKRMWYGHCLSALTFVIAEEAYQTWIRLFRYYVFMPSLTCFPQKNILYM